MKIIELKDTDTGYPFNLKQIEDRPKKLYVLGNIENLNSKCVTIVGSRNCTNYGRKNAGNIAYYLANKGYTIVSGLAEGIDTMAHIGALKAKGKTIAVLAHGLNKIYPQQNRKLAIEIIKNGGTIISEHNIHDYIKREDFKYRCRIMSGLSKSSIIVEAGLKSGSINTVNYALNQGRDVYAVLGNINSSTSIGTNMIIKEGAIPIMQVENEFIY